MALLHALPQVPQFDVVIRLVSQPFDTFPSQFAKPPEQVMPQEPAVHEAVPLVPLHTFPQLPQLDVFVLTLISQPLAALPSQFAKPALHAI